MKVHLDLRVRSGRRRVPTIAWRQTAMVRGNGLLHRGALDELLVPRCELGAGRSPAPLGKAEVDEADGAANGDQPGVDPGEISASRSNCSKEL